MDPSNYGDPMEAVKTFAAEIDRNQIKLERTVGGGVYREIHDHVPLINYLYRIGYTNSP